MEDGKDMSEREKGTRERGGTKSFDILSLNFFFFLFLSILHSNRAYGFR